MAQFFVIPCPSRSAPLVLFALFALLALARCAEPPGSETEKDKGARGISQESLEAQREEMVRTQIEARGIESTAVREAMRKVPRHEFVAKSYGKEAYNDYPLPIGHNQTISQPYIVALMTDLLDLQGGEKVLEIGTGCGYQTAVLAEMGAKIYSMEIVPELCELARKNLDSTGYKDIPIACRSGYDGWPEHAPFDAILVAAAPPEIPQALIDQLKEGGVMVLPVGEESQELLRIVKTGPESVRKEKIIDVRFVPMVERPDRWKP